MKTETVLSRHEAASLKAEYERLSSNANPGLMWEQFLEATLSLGLEKLRALPSLDALSLIGLLETGQMQLFHHVARGIITEQEKRAQATPQ